MMDKQISAKDTYVRPIDMLEHEMRDRLADKNAELARLQEALNRYRYAHAFAGADSWDGGPDMRRRLQWAHSSDEGRFLTEDQIAAIGKTFSDRAALAPRPSEKEER